MEAAPPKAEDPPKPSTEGGDVAMKTESAPAPPPAAKEEAPPTAAPAKAEEATTKEDAEMKNASAPEAPKPTAAAKDDVEMKDAAPKEEKEAQPPTTKATTTPPPEPCPNPEQYLKKRIAKRFETDIFFGTVDKIVKDDENENIVYWHVTYEDGDEEEMDLKELKCGLRLHGRRKDDDPTIEKKKEEPKEKEVPVKEEEKPKEDAAAAAAADPKEGEKKEGEKDVEKKEESKEGEAKADGETTEAKMETPPEDMSKCDICGYRDGHKTLVMITCSKCNVKVHRECYGLTTYQEKDFICWACDSVGRSILAQGAKDEPAMEIEMTERPTECALCSVSDGKTHAMHPIYDAMGYKARQLYQIKDGKPQLVWGHSLCAFLLATNGLLYGCNPAGTTHEGKTEDPGDNRSVNEELLALSDDVFCNEAYGDASPMHHFVYYLEREGKKPTKEDTLSIKSVAEHQDMVCYLCKASDKPSDVLRIPIFCSAGDKDEWKQFKGTHSHLKANECCTLPMHIGCAKWGTEHPEKARRVFYFPGRATPKSDTPKDPIRCIYCNDHALEVTTKHQAEMKKEEDRQFRLRTKKRKAAMTKKYTNKDYDEFIDSPSPAKRGRGRPSSSGKKPKTTTPTTSSGKKRGRPPKSPGSKKAAKAATPSSSPKKKRGRPPLKKLTPKSLAEKKSPGKQLKKGEPEKKEEEAPKEEKVAEDKGEKVEEKPATDAAAKPETPGAPVDKSEEKVTTTEAPKPPAPPVDKVDAPAAVTTVTAATTSTTTNIPATTTVDTATTKDIPKPTETAAPPVTTTTTTTTVVAATTATPPAENGAPKN